jgi:D-alanyl-lipoteichoic acid acyltransferase DltB (MBOAT superfamily)
MKPTSSCGTSALNNFRMLGWTIRQFTQQLTATSQLCSNIREVTTNIMGNSSNQRLILPLRIYKGNSYSKFKAISYLLTIQTSKSSNRINHTHPNSLLLTSTFKPNLKSNKPIRERLNLLRMEDSSKRNKHRILNHLTSNQGCVALLNSKKTTWELQIHVR